MKLTYFGTAASEGWPAVFCNCQYCNAARKLGGKNLRTRSQAMIDDKLLIDFPPDAYSHALYGKVPFTKVRDVIFTHTHMDHFFPTDLVLQTPPFSHDRESILQVFGNEEAYLGTKKKAKSLYGTDDLTGILDFHILKYNDTFETSTGYKVTVLKADHGRDDQDFFIFLIEKDGKTMLYAHDTGWFPDETWKGLAGKKLDFLSIDGTNGPMEGQKGHMGIPAVLKTLDKLREMKVIDDNTKVVMSHFSHNGGLLHKELEEKVNPHNIEVAYDGYSVEF